MNTVRISLNNSKACLVLLSVVLGLLSACSNKNPTPESFERYLHRLSNVIEQDIPTTDPFVIKNNYPAKRDLRHDYPSSSLNLLDWHQLNHCKLYPYVSNHNGSLGKFASNSQRLVYEVNFIKYAPACIVSLRANDKQDIADQLSATLALKKATFEKRLWAAIIGSQEMRTFWQPPYELCNYPDDTNLAMVDTIQKLIQLSQSLIQNKNHPEQLTIDSYQLEHLLKNLSQGDGGYLLRALALQKHYLQQANSMLEKASYQKTLCSNGQANQKQHYLMNVVQKFFVGDIQLWSAAINQRYYQLLSAMQHLEKTLASGEPIAYTQWRQAREQQLEQLKQQPAKHIAAIKALTASCHTVRH